MWPHRWFVLYWLVRWKALGKSSFLSVLSRIFLFLLILGILELWPSSEFQKTGCTMQVFWNGSSSFILNSSAYIVWFSHQVMSDSCDPVNCSPSGSFVHGIFQVRILECFAISFSKSESCSGMSDSLWPEVSRQAIGVSSLSFLQGIFPTQGSNTGLPHCRQILHQLSHKGSPLYILCILCSKMKMVWNEILVVVAQFCTIQKTTELSTLNEWILWYVNYISIKLLKKRKT